jgi:hypothetical protein
LIHTADGELFRQALIHAGQRCNLVVFTGEERELFATACRSLGMTGRRFGQCTHCDRETDWRTLVAGRKARCS